MKPLNVLDWTGRFIEKEISRMQSGHRPATSLILSIGLFLLIAAICAWFNQPLKITYDPNAPPQIDWREMNR